MFDLKKKVVEFDLGRSGHLPTGSKLYGNHGNVIIFFIRNYLSLQALRIVLRHLHYIIHDF